MVSKTVSSSGSCLDNFCSTSSSTFFRCRSWSLTFSVWVLTNRTSQNTWKMTVLGPWDWCWFMWMSWWCQVRKQAPWPKIAQPTYITLQNLQGFCQGSSSHSHSFSWSLRTSAAALHWFPRGLGELVPPISAHLAVVEVARKQLTTTRPDMWGRYSWNNWLILKKVEQVGREKGERKGWDGMGSSTSPAAFLFYTYKYMYIYICMYVFIYVYIYIYI